MKRIIILIIFFVFFTMFLACSFYSGISYSEKENIYYLTKSNGELYKCKLINKKLYCIEIKLENTD